MQRRAASEASNQLGLKSSLRSKHQAQSDPGPLRNRVRTEAERGSDWKSEQQTAAGNKKSVLVAISRGEAIVERGVCEHSMSSTRGIEMLVFAGEFEEQYVELGKLGNGAYGTVYSGHRIKDSFPVSVFIEHTHAPPSLTQVFLLLQVAIKHIDKLYVDFHGVVSHVFDLSISLKAQAHESI